MSSSTEVQGTQVWILNANDSRSKNEEKLYKDAAATWDDIHKNVDETKTKESNEENKTSPTNENRDGNINVTPTMVFSVIGDSYSLVPRPWPKTVFQTALIEAAKNGGETWIFYNEKDGEVSNVVKDAYQNYEDLDLESTSVDLNDPKRHVKLISISGKKTETSSTLSMPTIFSPRGGKGDKFLLKFEEFVSNQEVYFFGPETDFHKSVPIVILVCEGDIRTIAHISKALQRKLPVVIMKGSGKAADLVLDFLDNCSPSVLLRKAGIAFGIEFDDEKYGKMMEHLQKIEKNRELVGVFDLDHDDPLMLSNIVGEAVISCWSIRKILPIDSKDVKKLTQTIHQTFQGHSVAGKSLNNGVKEKDYRNVFKGNKWWPRAYVLNPKFCTPTTLPLHFYLGYQIMQEKHLTEDCGPVLLFEALKSNRCDYVSVLLDGGVKLQDNYLSDLYLEAYESKFGKKSNLLVEDFLKQIPEAKELYQTLKKMKAKKSEEKDSVLSDARTACCKILHYQACTESKDKSTANILLWAIFVNRKELAEICWLRGEDHMLTALISSVLLEKLSKKAIHLKEQTLSNDLQEHSKIFEQRSINLMDRMHEENTNLAIELMDNNTIIWGIGSNPLTIAYENLVYEVVAHTCSQKSMNSKWYRLPSDLQTTPLYKIAVTNPGKFCTAPKTKFIFNYVC